MQHYTIQTGNTIFPCELRTSGGFVIDASPAIDWAINLEFSHVRSYCERKGWKIVPTLKKNDESNVVTFRNVQYNFIWHDNRLVRIVETKDGETREIGYNELPEQVKGVL